MCTPENLRATCGTHASTESREPKELVLTLSSAYLLTCTTHAMMCVYVHVHDSENVVPTHKAVSRVNCVTCIDPTTHETFQHYETPAPLEAGSQGPWPLVQLVNTRGLMMTNTDHHGGEHHRDAYPHEKRKHGRICLGSPRSLKEWSTRMNLTRAAHGGRGTYPALHLPAQEAG